MKLINLLCSVLLSVLMCLPTHAADNSSNHILSFLIDASYPDVQYKLINELVDEDFLRLSMTCKGFQKWVKSQLPKIQAKEKVVVYFFPQYHADTFYGDQLYTMSNQRQNGTFDAQNESHYQNLLKDHGRAILCQKNIFKHMGEVVRQNPDIYVYDEGIVADTETVFYSNLENYQKIRGEFVNFDIENLTERQTVLLVFFGATQVLFALGKYKHLKPTEDHDLNKISGPLGKYASLGIVSDGLPKRYVSKNNNHKELVPLYDHYKRRVRENNVITRIKADSLSSGQKEFVLNFGAGHTKSFRYFFGDQYQLINMLHSTDEDPQAGCPFAPDKLLKLEGEKRDYLIHIKGIKQRMQKVYNDNKQRIDDINKNCLVKVSVSIGVKLKMIELHIKNNNIAVAEMVRLGELKNELINAYEMSIALEDSNTFEEFFDKLKNGSWAPLFSTSFGNYCNIKF